MIEPRTSARRCLALLTAILAGGLLSVVSPAPAGASVTSVSGGAFGYQTYVGLFGGPPSLRGFGQTIPPGNAGSASPSVTLPSTGGNLSQSDPDGAKGDYGPASIFAGIWPLDVAAARHRGPSA